MRGARISRDRRPCRLPGRSLSRPPQLAAATHRRVPDRVNPPAEIFRSYDIRGVVGRSLTPEVVRAIGRALGTLGRERGAPSFAICRDGRLSGPELLSALADGLTVAGADAIDIGMAPTPVAYF